MQILCHPEAKAEGPVHLAGAGWNAWVLHCARSRFARWVQDDKSLSGADFRFDPNFTHHFDPNFTHHITLSPRYNSNFSSGVTTVIFSDSAWAMI